MIQYPSAAAASNGAYGVPRTDWSGEVTPQTPPARAPFVTVPVETGMAAADSAMTGGAHLDMKNNLPQEVLESPTTVQEAYKGSLRAMLARNVGNYIVATFLVGTQSTVSFEGVLYDVGNDYMTIYQSGRDRYIVSDIYSLKYLEFYDTQRRAVCDALLRENGWQSQTGQ